MNKVNLSQRILAILIVTTMFFTMIPVAFANTYLPYEFVVTGDKTSVKAGDIVTLTVTVNGLMNNAYLLQFQIGYDSNEFIIADEGENAFESQWYSEVTNGLGLGDIFTPVCANQPDPTDNTKKIFSVVYYDIMSPLFNNPSEFITEGDELWNKETAVAAKMLFTAQKDIEDITGCFVIGEAINGYGDKNGTLANCNDTTLVQFSETGAVLKAINAINEIDATVTYSSKAKIEAARTAYDAVLDKLKGNVTNYATLTTAETSLGLIQSEIDAVADKIKAIGEVTLEDINNDGEADSETKIKEANSAYTALEEKDSDAAESLKNYGTDNVNYLKLLETAESKLAELKLEAADKAAAQIVIDKIKALDKTITLEDEAAIDDARTAYGALTDTQKGHVSNLAVLEAAESQLATLKVHKAAAEALVEYINKIPQDDAVTPENVDDVQGQIDSAKSSYATISKAGLASLVTNWELVEKAQTRVTELKDNIAAANSFVDKVESICSKVDLDSGDSITSAIHEYDDFNDEIKGFVAQAKEDLDEAKTRYNNMVSAKTLIDALPAVADVTPACKDALEAAQNAYGLLDDADKQTVDTATASKLSAVEEAYTESVKRVNAATDAIDAIDAEITLESEKSIIEAKTAYESLTAAEKKYLETYNGIDYGSKLDTAYNTYLGLVDTKEKEDMLQAGLVMSKIDALNNITLQSGEAIAAAENAYKALTDDQKTIVKSTMYGDSDKNYYDRLEEIREIYNELVADNNAVQAVITAIGDIGTVNYSDECLEAIEKAESAYDALVEADKTSGKNLASQVANYSVLTTAREDYGILENIVTLIGGIGEAENTDEHLSKLNAAQAAYDALDDEDKPKTYLKEQLTEQKQILDAAWYEYKLLLVKYVQLDITMSDGVTKKNLVVFTNMPEGQMIALDGNKVSVMKLGEAVYNTIVTDSKLSEEVLSALKLVDSSSTDEPYMLGDVDNSAGITGNDASIANKYAARVTEALNLFANDPMAFARADVNGSGTVTALDAFMIAQKGVGSTQLDDPFATHFQNK